MIWTVTGRMTSGSDVIRERQNKVTNPDRLRLLVPVTSVGDGALVEVELPAVVAEDPERGTVRGCQRRRGSIGGQGDVLC
jgi:hypothetical protein